MHLYFFLVKVESKDLLGILYGLSYISIFRHLIPIAIRDAQNDIAATGLQHASWLGNTTGLAIVSNNNIFIRDSPVGKDRQITITGLPGVIYNGVPDWLYQGEFFFLLFILLQSHKPIYCYLV